MIEFKDIGFEDKKWLDALFKNGNIRSAEYNFSYLFFWFKPFDFKIANIDGCFTARMIRRNTVSYLWPVGENVASALEEIEKDAAQLGVTPRFFGEYERIAEGTDRYFPGKYDIVKDRPWYDYIYTAEKLASLSGKKLHSKKNHINSFLKRNTWSIEEITDTNIAECRAMCDRWFALKGNDDPDCSAEEEILRYVFEHYRSLELEGILLRSGGQVIAFSMGELLCRDTYLVHFEKAFSDIRGAYSMINREFARFILSRYPCVVYINREDDMGLENIRKAKMSYHPDMMVEKCSAAMKK